MNSKSKTILVTSAVAVAVGVGVILVIKNRNSIKRQIQVACNVNPLKFREIQIINNADEAQIAVRRLKSDCQEYSVLGFDCEWLTVGGKRRPVSLLQLSSHRGLCALFRLCHMKGIPAELRELLEDDNIVKVGVAPADDASHMAHDYSVGVASTLDLRFLAELAGCKGEGLAKMADEYLQVTLDKNWRVRCSDWEAKELSEKQLDYASKDALVAIELFKKFADKIDPIYPWSNSKLVLSKLFENIHKYIDLKFKPTIFSPGKNNRNEQNSLLKPKNAGPNLKPPKRSFATRQSPLYDNCYMQAPDGELLCTCDKKKAEWYIIKNLATKISDDPFTIRLEFEPQARAVGEVGQYYTQQKENQCVVCGRKESYVRKNVVPREYRKFFPNVMKDHTSHDVLLLCCHCHQISDMSDLHLRQKLTQLCNAPMSTQEGGKKSREVPELKCIRNAARALFFNAEKIPDERKTELREMLKHCLPSPDMQEVPKELLHDLAHMNVTEDFANYVSHADKVVRYFSQKNGGLVELEKMWRQHFLDTMKPKFLPSLWSVDHNAQRLEIRADEGRCTVNDLAIAGVDTALFTSPEVLNLEPTPKPANEELLDSPKKAFVSQASAPVPKPDPASDTDDDTDTESNCTLKDATDGSFGSFYHSPNTESTLTDTQSQYYSNSTLASWKTSRTSNYGTIKSDCSSDSCSFKSCDDDDDQTIRDYDSDPDSDSTLSQKSSKA